MGSRRSSLGAFLILDFLGVCGGEDGFQEFRGGFLGSILRGAVSVGSEGLRAHFCRGSIWILYGTVPACGVSVGWVRPGGVWRVVAGLCVLVVSGGAKK